MKNKSFGALLLSLLGYFLIVLSIFFLYQGINSTREEVKQTKKELDIAKKKIEKLSNQLQHKNSKKSEMLSPVFPNSNEFNSMLGKNIPLIEITDLDLSNRYRRNKKGAEFHEYQFRFYAFNVGINSLKDVIVSVRDIYNDPKKIKIKSKTIGNLKNGSIDIESQQIGTYENFNVNTLNLKSRRLVYVTTMSKSYDVEEYTFDVIVEWKCGFYQVKVKIQESEGKLKYHYEYYDIDGKLIDFDKLQNSILK